MDVSEETYFQEDDLQLYMIRDMSQELPPLNLPDELALSSFKAGDEIHWDRIIQKSFNETPEKLNFNKTMKPDKRYKEENILFISHRGIPAATTTAWETNQELGYIHYVGTDPDFKGLKTGYYSSLAALHLFNREGKKFAELETDDFRTPAIITYLRLGFRPHCTRDYHESVWTFILKEERLATIVQKENLDITITKGQPLGELKPIRLGIAGALGRGGSFKEATCSKP